MISVIVPVYKVEKWLNGCLDSILNQNYRDFELILVDDGSPDRCGEICDDYATRDSRIYVLHQENRGLAAARNAGTKLAKGEYITYADSDDILYPDYLSTLFELMQKYNGDISVIPFIPFTYDLPVRDACKQETVRITGEQACERLFSNHEPFMIIATAKLYRRETVGDPVFPAGKLHEDEFVTYRMMAKARSVVIGSRCCYGYRQRENSIMSSIWKPERMDRLTALEEATVFLEKQGFGKAAALAQKRYLLNIEISAYQCGNRTARRRTIRDDLIRRHHTYLKNHKREIFCECTAFEKLTVWIFESSPVLYDCCAQLALLLINIKSKLALKS